MFNTLDDYGVVAAVMMAVGLIIWLMIKSFWGDEGEMS